MEFDWIRAAITESKKEMLILFIRFAFTLIGAISAEYERAFFQLQIESS